HSRDLQQHVLRQVVELNRGVAELTAAIHSSTEVGQPAVSTGHTSITPALDPADPVPLHDEVTEPTID
ncbi:hypothetical protein, partial [Actinoplanes sp. ATCC 53533]